MAQQLVNSRQIAALFGKPRQWTNDKKRDDPTFPQPVQHVPGSGPTKRMGLWRLSDIIAWRDAPRQRPTPTVQAPKPKRSGWGPAAVQPGHTGHEDDQRRFALDMAVQFICGWFDPDYAQDARIERMERAKKNKIKNQPRIRIEGDWL